MADPYHFYYCHTDVWNNIRNSTITYQFDTLKDDEFRWVASLSDVFLFASV